MREPKLLLNTRELSYGAPDGRQLIKGLSFKLATGQLLAVTGPNGTGKSTLLRVVLGELPASAGTVEVTAASTYHMAQLQNREFHIPMTLANVLAVHAQGAFKIDEALAIGLLSPRELDLAWNTASGGERQKALLTQALLAKPELLILDEPTNHLDAASRDKLCRLLECYVEDGTRSVLMICHEKLLSDGALRPSAVLDLSNYGGG